MCKDYVTVLSELESETVYTDVPVIAAFLPSGLIESIDQEESEGS